MDIKNKIKYQEVRAIIKRKDGTIEDLGIIASTKFNKKEKNNLVKAFSKLTKKILRKDDN